MASLRQISPLSDHGSHLTLYQSLDEPQIKRNNFIYRALAFAALEASFLILACFCLVKPIPVNPPSYISASVAKGVTTGIAVVWHASATLLIKDITSCIFSAECMAQYYRTRHLEPEDTDRVSCITSGLVSHALFFLTRRPTPVYRLSFILVLLMMILGPLGPSVISLGDSVMTRHQNMPIANLTMTETFAYMPQRTCSNRAHRISQMEFLETITFGYGTENDRMLVPWPQPSSGSDQGIITYETDVVEYDYDCQWPSFTLFDESLEGWAVGLANKTKWMPWSENSDGGRYSISILPLVEDGEASQDMRNPVQKTANSLSAFAFTSDFDTMDIRSTNTMVSAPETLPHGFPKENWPGTSVLSCETHYTTHRARVTLSGGRLNATILPFSPLIGNFPELAANAMISQGLLYSLGPESDDGPAIGPIAALTFLEPSKSNKSNNTSKPEPRKLLPLPIMNENLGKALKVTAKGYLSGYICRDRTDSFPSPEYSHINQTVTMQYQQNSLVSNMPFVIFLSILYTMMVLILAVLLWVMDVEHMRLFNLRTLEKVYGGSSSHSE